ncbi:MAG: hypothetical protein AB1627_14660 [Chloroflexota bacterium]
MSERDDDLRLERELRGLLGDRDPGPAPYGLRERVDRVPGRDAAGESVAERARRAIVAALGLAAAVVLVLVAVPLVAKPPGPGPGGPPMPVVTFDPTLHGPGLVPPPALEAEVLVVLGLLIVAGLVLAVAPSGPRRALAAFVLVAGLAVGGAQILLTHAAAGPVASSGGIGVRNVEPSDPARDGRYPVYVTAAPGDPFSFGFSVRNEGPLPIRLEGVVRDPAVHDGVVDYPTLRALWRDGSSQGGVTGPTGPVAPFGPIDLGPGEFTVLWLVWTASPCAAGPSFEPIGDETALVGIPELRVAYSVLGFARTAVIDLPFEILQPYQATCPALD